jgi:hypothetical protein
MIKNTVMPKKQLTFKTVYQLHLGLETKKDLREKYCFEFDYSEEAFRQRMKNDCFSPAEKKMLYAELPSHITAAYSFDVLFPTQLEITNQLK